MALHINFRIRVGDRFYFLNNIETAKRIDFDFSQFINIPIWQQCTEIKDVNNKMIYEGDILKYRIGTTDYEYEVKFGQYSSFQEKGNGFYLSPFKKEGSELTGFSPGPNYFRFEIVGNIFDKPKKIYVLKDFNPYTYNPYDKD